MRQDLIDRARAVWARHDRGTYTVPTHGLYPFQWNWDSAFAAWGFASFIRTSPAWHETQLQDVVNIPRSCKVLVSKGRLLKLAAKHQDLVPTCRVAVRA